MKRILSIALVLTMSFNQVGANCLAAEVRKQQIMEKQVEVHADEKLLQSDKVTQYDVEPIFAGQRTSGQLEVTRKSSPSLFAQILKILFKPVRWWFKANMYIAKLSLELILWAIGIVCLFVVWIVLGRDLTSCKCDSINNVDELKKYLKKSASLFHPDKLKTLRGISEEDANKHYQLTMELLGQISD